MTSHILSWIIFTPLAGAIAVLFVPKNSTRLSNDRSRGHRLRRSDSRFMPCRFSIRHRPASR